MPTNFVEAIVSIRLVWWVVDSITYVIRCSTKRDVPEKIVEAIVSIKVSVVGSGVYQVFMPT